jgi:hypothetical protein
MGIINKMVLFLLSVFLASLFSRGIPEYFLGINIMMFLFNFSFLMYLFFFIHNDILYRIKRIAILFLVNLFFSYPLFIGIPLLFYMLYKCRFWLFRLFLLVIGLFSGVKNGLKKLLRIR